MGKLWVGDSNGCWVQLWDQVNYTGNSRRLVGPADFPYLRVGDADWQPQVHSLHVGPNAYVQGYEDLNFHDSVFWLLPNQRVDDLTDLVVQRRDRQPADVRPAAVRPRARLRRLHALGRQPPEPRPAAGDPAARPVTRRSTVRATVRDRARATGVAASAAAAAAVGSAGRTDRRRMPARRTTPLAAAVFAAALTAALTAVLMAVGGADLAPPSTRPSTGPVRTTIVVDGKPVRVRGRVCSVVNDDGTVTVNGRPLAEVIDDDSPPLAAATRPTTHP